MLSIPIAAVPNQTLQVSLNNQACVIHLYQKATGLYLDLTVGTTTIVAGVLCQNSTPMVISDYLGFDGDLGFWDTQGTNDPDYTGLGTRYLLIYLSPAEANLLPIQATPPAPAIITGGGGGSSPAPPSSTPSFISPATINGLFVIGQTFPMNFGGGTAHVNVYWDPVSWAGSAAVIAAVLTHVVNNVEVGYTLFKGWFGNDPSPGQPSKTPQDPVGTHFNCLLFNVADFLANSLGTEFHFFGGSTHFGDVYVSRNESSSSQAPFFMLSGFFAELVECFEYLYNTPGFTQPWVPNNNVGEALSRIGQEEAFVLAEGPGSFWFYGSPQTWLNGSDPNQGGANRHDYSGYAGPPGSDQDNYSIGFCMLVIFWLAYKKKFTYAQIVQNGAATMQGLVTNLTSAVNMTAFFNDLNAILPAGTQYDLTQLYPAHPDNPWGP